MKKYLKKLKLKIEHIQTQLKKYTLLGLAVIMCISNIAVYAVDNGAASLLGTNKALGSPLLDSTFKAEDFDPTEVAIFGIFLSNFPYMLLDDYGSAFSKGLGGSDGYGYAALQFAGNAQQETLKNILDYAIGVQQSSGAKPIYKTKTEGADEMTVTPAAINTDTPEKATLKDLINFDLDNDSGFGGSRDKENPGINYKNNKDFRDVPKSSTGYEFWIFTDEAAKATQTVFSQWDGYDLGMLLAQAARMYTGVGNKEYTDQFEEKLKELIKSDEAYLGFDIFGNIVVKDPTTGKFLMVFPACANQYLTTSKSYNFLSAPIIGASYVDVDDRTYITKLEADKDGSTSYIGGLSAIDNDSSKAFVKGGHVLLYFDTDTISRDYKWEHYDFGNGLAQIIQSTFGDQNIGKVGLKIDVTAYDMAPQFRAMSRFMNIYGLSITDTSKALNTINKFNEDTKVDLFGNGVVVMPNYWQTNWAREYDMNRGLANFINEVYWGKIKTIPNAPAFSPLTQSAMISQIMSAKTATELCETIQGKHGKVAMYAYGYAALCGKKVDINGGPSDNGYSSQGLILDGNPGHSFDRFLKVLPRGDTMRILNNVLRVEPEAEFAQWTPMLYYTYLEWYGLIGRKTNTINEKLFDKGSFKLDTSKIVTTEITNESIKKMIGTVLDPDAGRSFRKKSVLYLITDFLYDSYCKIVYNSSNSTSGFVATTNNSTGFLNINTYANNPFTSWVYANYARILIPILTISLLGILLLGIIKKNGVSWVLITIFTVINATLLVPSLGEMVPFLSNSIQERLFANRLDFWAISETLQNAKLEREIANQTNGAQANDVMSLAKAFNSYYMDRSLMLRLDISRKVTETAKVDLVELQKYQTTRWLLPSIVKQYTGKNNSLSYVYISLSDALDNAKFLYWMYSPEDKLNNSASDTQSAAQVDRLSTPTRMSMFAGYQDLYMIQSNKQSARGYVADNAIDDESIHRSFYFIPDLYNVPQLDLSLLDEEILAIAESSSADLEDAANLIEVFGPTYNNTEDSSVVPIMGYLWATESPLSYFYCAVKDNFETDTTFGSLITDLQGLYKAVDSDGTIINNVDEDNPQPEIRTSFMHYDTTGAVKDVCDMEELFTNTIPYLYTVQTMAGGFDGESGYFGTEKVKNYALYRANNRSWLFRSNWATKLVESKEYAQPITFTSQGTQYTVDNPMYPPCYPVERPMVFSEAEMLVRGLTVYDLNEVELKILKVNEKVTERWTLLINYANLEGMEKEVLYKQMSLIATTAFNAEFAPGGIFKEQYALYPTAVELRSISFDSVIRMLMLNATRDSGQVSGDIMYNLLNSTDILSAFLLLAVCFTCVVILPLVINILSALFLYLGLYSSIINIASSNKTKLVNTTAYFINILCFIVINIIYYGGIALLMGMTSPADVLNVDKGVIDITSPSIVLFLLLILSILYVSVVIKLAKFIFKHRNDLGAAAIGEIGSSIGAKLKDSLSGFKGWFSGLANNGAAKSPKTSGKVERYDGDEGEDSSYRTQLEKEQTGYEDIESAYVQEDIPLDANMQDSSKFQVPKEEPVETPTEVPVETPTEVPVSEEIPKATEKTKK